MDIPECSTDTGNVSKVYNEPSNTSMLNRVEDDLFITILQLPKCLEKHYTDNCGQPSDESLSILQLSVRNFPIPSINIPAHEKKFAGSTYYESSKTITEYGELTISFKVDDKLSNYNTLYSWLNMLNDVKNGKRSDMGKDSYSTTYTVALLNQYKIPIGFFNFEGVIPVTLGGFDLNYTSNGEAIFIDFTFTFDHYSFEPKTN